MCVLLHCVCVLLLLLHCVCAVAVVASVVAVGDDYDGDDGEEDTVWEQCLGKGAHLIKGNPMIHMCTMQQQEHKPYTYITP